jgi:hypothetical protein
VDDDFILTPLAFYALWPQISIHTSLFPLAHPSNRLAMLNRSQYYEIQNRVKTNWVEISQGSNVYCEVWERAIDGVWIGDLIY